MAIILSAACWSAPTIASSCARATSTPCATPRPSSAGARRRPIRADFLWTCTLVSTGEPCAMCTGTLYWANIGRLVYGFEEAKLLALTGDHPENPTMSLSCAHGPRLRPEADRCPWPLPRDRGRTPRPAPGSSGGSRPITEIPAPSGHELDLRSKSSLAGMNNGSSTIAADRITGLRAASGTGAVNRLIESPPVPGNHGAHTMTCWRDWLLRDKRAGDRDRR